MLVEMIQRMISLKQRKTSQCQFHKNTQRRTFAVKTLKLLRNAVCYKISSIAISFAKLNFCKAEVNMDIYLRA